MKSAKSKPFDLGASKNASATLAESIESIRLQIVLAFDERSSIERAPVSQDEAVARLSQWTSGMRAQGLARVRCERFTAPTFNEPIPSDTLSLVIGVASEMIFEALNSKIAESYAEEEGLTPDRRRSEIERIEGAILAMELQEEALIRAAEKVGLQILRRADANPMAVLAADEALP